MDLVLPCMSGSVSEGWRDRTARYDDLHLGTTIGKEYREIFQDSYFKCTLIRQGRKEMGILKKDPEVRRTDYQKL